VPTARPRLLADLTPLRESPAYRRLWVGQALANVGQQLALVAIGLQVYDLTGSTFAVGLVGLFAFVPLVALGLYGGSIIDAYDRRRVALRASAAVWCVSLVTAGQAWLEVGSVGLLYALTACHSAAFAVNNPARSAIVPRLVRRELLPAANALQTTSFMLGTTLGPLLAGVLIELYGFGVTYTVDVITYTAALWAVFRLPSLPPEGEVRRAGLASVVEGLRYLRTRPNVRMTFLVDIAAMVTSFPRALFPAVAFTVLGGGAGTVGLLAAALAVGSVLAGVLSGRLGHVRRQGLAVLWCVAGWGLAIAGFGVVIAVAARAGPGWWALPAAALLLALAGAADAVSAVFRSTILQAATPDALRGRLQGVFIVVVAGGPRVGDFVTGSAGEVFGEGLAAVAGGLACVLAVVVLARRQPRFARYDATIPEP
jgi:ENTS family enterobactin (siderophore) exporter